MLRELGAKRNLVLGVVYTIQILVGVLFIYGIFSAHPKNPCLTKHYYQTESCKYAR